jgi:hypothetical protein
MSILRNARKAIVHMRGGLIRDHGITLGYAGRIGVHDRPWPYRSKVWIEDVGKLFWRLRISGRMPRAEVCTPWMSRIRFVVGVGVTGGKS